MHHTKVKADIGVAKCFADLVGKGYVSNTEDGPKVIRFEKTRNNQGKYVSWADDYRVIKRESSETIRHTPEMVKT